MPLEMSVEDLTRDLKNCVVMFKNKPVYVTGIGRDGTVSFLDLLSQRPDEAPFTLKAFDSPVRRIGFVNVDHGVVYVNRISVRKYYMGVNRHNVTIKAIGGVEYENGAANAKQRIQMLNVPEIGDAIMDKYPTLKESVEQVRKYVGACAFDKQFAVTSNMKILYKGDVVGTVKKTATKTSDIVWNEGKEYLSILLDNNHEKTVRDFRPKAA